MSQRRSNHQRRRAFSLVEAVGSMAITGIVMAASVGALQLFAVNGPRLERREKVRGELGVILHRMRSEIRLATAVQDVSVTSIRIVIPDTNGDTINETIEYSWSGVTGDPLLRTENGDPAEEVISDLNHFQFTVTAESISGIADTQSAEVVLFSHDGYRNLSDFRVENGRWPEQFFRPTLPVEATSWRVTRLQFKAKYDGTKDGTTAIALYRADELNLPTGAALETRTMSEASLAVPYAWQPFAFSSVINLSPIEGLCLVLNPIASDNTCAVEMETGMTADAKRGFSESRDSGATWQVDNTNAMQLYVWGTYNSPQSAMIPGAMLVVHVEAEALPKESLRVLRVDTAVTCLNRPSLGGFALGDLPIERIIPRS